jgi:DHA3 family macrolide efflux protein-like MFS transporter
VSLQFTAAEKPHWKRRFYPIWVGQAFSLLGSRLVSFALIWYLADQTERGVVLATASLVGLIPELILMPFAGACVDRWNRRQILIIADGTIALATLVIALLVFTELITIWHIYLLMAVRSVAGAFHNPAMKASTTLLVPKERYTNIAGMNQLLDSLLEIATPCMGAIFLAMLGIGGVLLIDVLTAMIAIAPLFFYTIPQPEQSASSDEKNPLLSLLKDVKEGFQYVYTWKGLFYAFTLATISNALILPAFNLLPLLIKRDFGLGVESLAVLQTTLGISMAIGAAIMSVWGGFKHKMLTMSLGIGVMGVGMLLFGFSPVNLFLLILLGGAIFGFANPFHNAPMRGILQENIEPEMQGRVFALLVTTAKAATPIGLIVAGPLADHLNVQIWFIAAGVYCIFMAVALMAIPSTANLEYGKQYKHPVPSKTN